MVNGIRQEIALKKIYDEVKEDLFHMSNVRIKSIEKTRKSNSINLLAI